MTRPPKRPRMRFNPDPTVKAFEIELMARVGVELRRSFDEAAGRGIRVGNVADRLGVQTATVRDRFGGRKNLQLTTLARLAMAIGCSVDVTLHTVRARRQITPEAPAAPEREPTSLHSMIVRARIPSLRCRRWMMPSRTTKAVLHALAETNGRPITREDLGALASLDQATTRHALAALETVGLVENRKRPRRGALAGEPLSYPRLRVDVLADVAAGRITIGGPNGEEGEAAAQDAGGQVGADRRDPRGPAAEDAA